MLLRKLGSVEGSRRLHWKMCLKLMWLDVLSMRWRCNGQWVVM